jgi:hypothetical protein
MWLKDEASIKKAKKADKKAHGHEGFDSRDGYIPYQTCIDFIKLVKTGTTAGALATQFELGLNDVLTIITYWTQYIKADEDMNDIKCYGGNEYAEIQKIKKIQGSISQEDIDNVRIDLHLFEKPEGENK